MRSQVWDLGIEAQGWQSGGFVKIAHNIHALDGLTGLAFDQVIDRGENNDAPGALIDFDADVVGVGAAGPFGLGVGSGGQDAYPGGVTIKGGVNGGQVVAH